MTKGRWLALALLALFPAPAAAEWQFKPFLGLAFGGETTLIDPEAGAGHKHPVVGLSTLFVGEMFGVEGDFGLVPGFFKGGSDAAAKDAVVSGSVMTLTGNVVIAMPRRLTQYTLRPYVAGGGGLMRARSELFFDPLPVASTLPAFDVGGGATGFLTRRIGVSWDLRYFRSVFGSGALTGTSFGPEQLSFWRANMAVAIRY